MNLIGIYRAFHAIIAEYTFFPSPQGIFSTIDHTFGHISSLSSFKKIEIVSSLFFWPQKYEIAYQKRKKGKKHKHVEDK